MTANINAIIEQIEAWTNERPLCNPTAPLANVATLIKAYREMEAERNRLREQNQYWQRGHNIIEACLAETQRADPLDAPIPLVGVEAKRWHAYRGEAFRHALEMMGVPECYRTGDLAALQSEVNDG